MILIWFILFAIMPALPSDQTRWQLDSGSGGNPAPPAIAVSMWRDQDRFFSS